MRRLFAPIHAIGLIAAACGVQPLRAQDAPAAASAAPIAPAPIDPSSIPLPNLAFTPDADAQGNYDKYFYFHRAETDFATAYADIQECDGYARGFTYSVVGPAVPYPYAGTVAGALGGALGSVLSDAIYGSAERRRLRRVNMRTCMTYKGYSVFGLPKSIWEQFNFEEGNLRIEEGRRRQLLGVQARIASGPRPQAGEMAE
jgi:hypothetical protein